MLLNFTFCLSCICFWQHNVSELSLFFASVVRIGNTMSLSYFFPHFPSVGNAKSASLLNLVHECNAFMQRMYVMNECNDADDGCIAK